jgi:hypothetical protein
MTDRRVLLVEGKDDEHVVKHLCRAHHIDPLPFEIHQPEGPATYSHAGIQQLLEHVPIRLDSGVDRLAVILDADENAVSRWKQLRHRLRALGVQNLPEDPPRAGLVMDIDRETRVVRFGVWIMPDNTLPGTLEHFLRHLVPSNDRMSGHVDRFLHGIPVADRLFPAPAFRKAWIHSFLAVQETPGRPLGLAITFRYLDPDNGPLVGPFLEWLRRTLIEDA